MTEYSFGGIQLNEAQNNTLDAIKQNIADGKKRGMIVLPSGIGKTVLSGFLVRETGFRTLYIAHISEILYQAHGDNRYFKGEKSYSKIVPDKKLTLLNGQYKFYEGNVVFASIQTISRDNHLLKFPKDYFDLIIIDEYHHAKAMTYQKIISYFEPKFLLGMTATPYRVDDKCVSIPQKEDSAALFSGELLKICDNNIIYYMNRNEATEKLMLVPFNYYLEYDSLDDDEFELISDVAQEKYGRRHKYTHKDINRKLMIEERDKAIVLKFKEKGFIGKKTIGFCVDIEHATRMKNLFNENGISSEIITAKTKKELRREIVEHFRKNGMNCLFTVNCLNEGVDFPDCEVLLFMRNTISKTIFEQQLGRGLRHFPNKSHVNVMDFVQNWEKHFLFQYLVGKNTRSIQLNSKTPLEWNNGLVFFSEELVKHYKDLLLSKKRMEYIMLLNKETLKNVIKRASYGQHLNFSTLCEIMAVTPSELRSVLSREGVSYSEIADTPM